MTRCNTRKGVRKAIREMIKEHVKNICTTSPKATETKSFLDGEKSNEKEKSFVKIETKPEEVKKTNADTSLVTIASAIGASSLVNRKKRTAVKRKRLTNIIESDKTLVDVSKPASRLAKVTEPVILPPKSEAMDDKSKIKRIINYDPIKTENEPKRQRGRPIKQEVAISGGPDPSLTTPTRARRRKNSINKRSSVRGNKGVPQDANQSSEAHNTSLIKNELKQLQTPPPPQPPLLPLLYPQQTPWPALSPTWIQSQPYSQSFLSSEDIGINGADYKGKKVVIDDQDEKPKIATLDNDLNSLFSNPKGGVKIHDSSNENLPSEPAHLTPEERKFFREFVLESSEVYNNYVLQVNGNGNGSGNSSKKIINQVSSFMSGNQRNNLKPKISMSPSTYLRGPKMSRSTGGTLPLPAAVEPPELWLQACAEAMYGKEAFSKGEPPVLGPHTALMVLAQNPHCEEAMMTLMKNGSQLPPLSAGKTTQSLQRLPPPPGFAPLDHDVVTRQENVQLRQQHVLPSQLASNPEFFEKNFFRQQGSLFMPVPPVPLNHDVITRDENVQLQQQQVLSPQLASNREFFEKDFFQQQGSLFMPVPPVLPPQLPPQMTMFGVPNFPGQNLLGNPGLSSDCVQDLFMFGKWGYRGPSSGF